MISLHVYMLKAPKPQRRHNGHGALIALMPIRRLQSHLNIVACSHNLIAWRPLGTYAAGNRLASPLTSLRVET